MAFLREITTFQRTLADYSIKSSVGVWEVLIKKRHYVKMLQDNKETWCSEILVCIRSKVKNL